jgi:uncharacterized membrane protein YbaN (DUF454 family)
MREIKNKLYIAFGTSFVILGVIGIFVPLMPSTIFLLIGASCYARGSQRFYTWLMNNRWLGGMIRDYREGRGIPLRQKLLTMIILWITIGSSAYFFIENGWVKMLLICIAAGVSLHLIILKTRKSTPINKTTISGVSIPETVKEPD